MRPSVRLQAGEIEVWRLVHIPSVLCSQRDVSREGIIGAAAIHECSFGLKRCTGKITCTAGGIKNQRSTSAQHVGL